MDRLRASFSKIGEYERGLKRYRLSEVDEEWGGVDWAQQDPYDPHAKA